MANVKLESENLKGENSDAFSILANELQSTATRTSKKFNNPRCNGVILIVTTANEAGTASFTPSIVGYDASGTAYTVATFTAITANGTNVLCLYPAVLTGFSNEAKAAPLPREWAVVLTYAGTPATDKIDTKVDAVYVA